MLNNNMVIQDTHIYEGDNSGIQRCVILLKQTEVLEVRTVFIIRIMMKAVHTSETSVYFNDATRRCIPKSCPLHAHHCENLKSDSHI
jgi:hypothetical protein